MTSIAPQLETLINDFFTKLNSLTEDDLAYKSSPTKWSNKELIGHLIDSVQNNIHRFIVAQYEDEPTIIYNQDKWVAINNYQQWNAEDLIRLWYFLNRQIAIVVKNISGEMSQRICRSNVSNTIEWVATDYIKHLKHRMHQVLNLELVAYP
ncbi:MAG TPA: DinB family protein [Chitinophagaceae bacterium]